MCAEKINETENCHKVNREKKREKAFKNEMERISPKMTKDKSSIQEDKSYEILISGSRIRLSDIFSDFELSKASSYTFVPLT